MVFWVQMGQSSPAKEGSGTSPVVAKECRVDMLLECCGEGVEGWKREWSCLDELATSSLEPVLRRYRR